MPPSRTRALAAFSVESAGSFDLDAELDLWFSGLGKVRLEFKGSADIRQLGRHLRPLTDATRAERSGDRFPSDSLETVRLSVRSALSMSMRNDGFTGEPEAMRTIRSPRDGG